MNTHAQKRPRDIDTQFRELARRSNTVSTSRFSWDAETDELLVCVYDERRDVYFEIHPERDRRLDGLLPPYAHVVDGHDAACRRKQGPGTEPVRSQARPSAQARESYLSVQWHPRDAWFAQERVKDEKVSSPSL